MATPAGTKQSIFFNNLWKGEELYNGIGLQEVAASIPSPFYAGFWQVFSNILRDPAWVYCVW